MSVNFFVIDMLYSVRMLQSLRRRRRWFVWPRRHRRRRGSAAHGIVGHPTLAKWDQTCVLRHDIETAAFHPQGGVDVHEGASVVEFGSR